LRLAQGRVDAAMTAIRGMADEALAPGPRAIVLDAYVEIAIAADDAASARGAAAELAEIATRRSVPFLRALSARASGAVLLAEGDARGAVSGLRQSLDLWRELEAPYEAARARASIGLALRRLGDEESAAAELNASRQAFERLGAAADLARVDTLLERRERPAAGPLTGREVEVLRLVASGKSNREIAGSLRISEKTVARHLSNIFTKLDLPSRTAAAAYAYDNDLV
jgi:ATP/maltotriose-dependent transcriptional regulator MalT